MQVRYPKWDFAKVRAHWAPNNPEFAQAWNASSSVPAYIEPYLVKVMAKARAALPPEHEALREQLDIFIKQEMQHCKQHLAFNKALRAQGYAGMLEIEKRYEADYNKFLEKRSLRFNCAYSEGFEALSSISVTTIFEDCDELFAGADEDVVDLWKWHLAEEYEHREVAHDVYHALFGKNKLWAYLYRLYGFFYAVAHISTHGKRISAYLLGKDREGMTPEQLEASLARQKHANAVLKRRAWAHSKEILSPSYNPRARTAPRGLTEYLSGAKAPSAARAA